MISCGLTTPSVFSEKFVFPPDLFEKHCLRKKDYITKPTWQLIEQNRLESLYNQILAMLKVRAKVALKLLKDEPWDFFII